MELVMDDSVWYEDDYIPHEEKFRKPLTIVKSNNEDFFKHMKDLYLDKHKILHDRMQLMELFENESYDELLKILSSCILFLEEFKVDLHTETIDLLFGYCVKNNDIEFINKVISRFGSHNIFKSRIKYDITNCNVDMLNIISEMECFKSIEATILIPHAIDTKNIYLLSKLENAGHKLNDTQLSQIIFSSNIEMMEHIKSQNIDIQTVFDNSVIKETVSWLNSPLIIQKYQNLTINVDTIKFIMENGIDVSNKLDELVEDGIFNGNLEFIQFCYQLGTINIDSAIKLSCSSNKLDILEYLLEIGGNINVIDSNDLLNNANYQTVVLLSKYNYVFPTNILHYIFRNSFVEDVNIDEIYKLYNYVGNFNYIFHRETQFVKHVPSYTNIILASNTIAHGNNKLAISDLELLVCQNKIEHIKMMATYALNNLMKEVDRLFIVAIANGRLEIAEYLLELGAVVDYELAFNVAFFFGHIHMVKYLLNYNTNLTPELFLMAAYGSSNDNKHIGYANLIQDTTIFRNDVFNIGDNYIELFQLLIDNNVRIPDFSFLGILDKKYYSVEIIGYMINLGFNPTLLLEICIKYDMKSITEYLIENGAENNL